MRTRRWALLALSFAAILLLGAYAVTATPPAKQAEDHSLAAATLQHGAEGTASDHQADVCRPGSDVSTDVASLPFGEQMKCTFTCHQVQDCPLRLPPGCSSWTCQGHCCVC